MIGEKPGNASLKVFLINLDRSADRLVAMQEKLGRAGLSFQRVPAVDGATIEFPISEFSESPFASNMAADPIPRKWGAI